MTEQVDTAQEIRTDGINVSDAASSKVKSLLAQEGRDDLQLRIAVQPGGCSGLRYQLFFDERNLDGDVVTDFDGVSVVVDRMSVPYLNGATIDFVDSIEKQGFTIDNPNATRLVRLRGLVPLSSPEPDPADARRHECAVSPSGTLGAVVRVWSASVQVQVHPGGQVRGGFADLDLGLGDLAGEVGEPQRGGRHRDRGVVDPLAGEVDLGLARRAVVVHLDGGVLVVVGKSLVAHASTLGATDR